MIKFISSFIAILFILTGCVTPPSQEQIAALDFGSPPDNQEATIKKYFDGVLFDPYSAHYDFESPQKYWMKEAPLAGVAFMPATSFALV